MVKWKPYIKEVKQTIATSSNYLKYEDYCMIMKIKITDLVEQQ